MASTRREFSFNCGRVHIAIRNCNENITRVEVPDQRVCYRDIQQSRSRSQLTMLRSCACRLLSQSSAWKCDFCLSAPQVGVLVPIDQAFGSSAFTCLTSFVNASIAIVPCWLP